jgi:glycerol transport system ATP-binding protein
MRGFPRADMQSRAEKMLDLVGLGRFAERYPRELSGGQQQRVALARGLVFNPDVLLLDEPLGALDKNLREHMQVEIKRIHREVGITMIYVTHDQTEALTFADTVVVMHDGRVVQSGTPAELFDKPAHTFVGYFIGSPGMNILPAEVRGREARVDGHVIALNRSYDRLPAGAKIEIGVRPEFVEAVAPGPGLLTARLERIDDLGRIRFARTRLGEARLAARAPAGFTSPDGTAGLKFDPSHVHVYADSLLVEGAA